MANEVGTLEPTDPDGSSASGTAGGSADGSGGDVAAPASSGGGEDPTTTALRAELSDSLPDGRVVVGGLWATAVGGLLIVLMQLDSLVAQVLVAGRTYSLTGLTSTALAGGPGATGAAWESLAGRLDGADAVRGLSGWITAYAAVDLAFIALYGAALLLALWRARSGPGVGRPWFTLALVAGATGVVADVGESLALALIASGVPVAGVVFWLSAVKWLGLLVAGVAALVGARQAGDRPRGEASGTTYGESDTRGAVGRAGRVLRALYTHRFSLLVVVPFGALGLASGSDILDQFPDVQRQWVDDRPWLRVTVATALNLVVAVIVWLVGRLRSHHVAKRVLPSAAPYREPTLWPWAFTSAVILLGGAVSAWVLGLDVLGPRFWIAAAVPALLWATSLGLRWRDRRAGVAGPWSPYRRPVTPEQAATTRAVGDVLALLVLVFPALGLVRAFTAPVALGDTGFAVGFLVFGALAALATWVLPVLVDRVLTPRLPPGFVTAVVPGQDMGAGSARWGRRVSIVLLLVGVGIFLLIGFRPGWLVDVAGVTGLALLSAAAVAVPLGITVVLLQAGGAPDVLSRPGLPVLRTAPIMTIIVLTALVVGLTGNDAGVHGLRQLGTGPAPQRPTLVDRLGQVRSAPGCAATLPATTTPAGARVEYGVRPVFVLAAEGGGIRAAAWTALGVDALQEAGGPCADALMSSGASGGAVGLTLAAFSRDGGAYAAAASIAGPEGLGSAVTGLLVRDPVRSVTGIAFPSGERDDGWVDRAGLMEQTWESHVDGLKTPFLDGSTDRSTGALVLNSTSVASQCRTLLSQVALDVGPEPLDCHTPTAPVDSVDLLPTLRGGCGEDGVQQLRASTVALLASRFPYVTPSGVVTGCADGEPVSQQVVDGGYADNDGIGTVVDLSSQWLPALRAHNAEVLASEGGGTLLVPVFVYLDNGTGSDIATNPGGDKNELLVPLQTRGGATAGLSGTDAQLHRALAVFSTPSVVPGCAGGANGVLPPVCGAVDAWRGAAVKVFYQPSRPSISAPLGWVLSGQSLTTLQCARDGQVAPVLPARAKGCDQQAVVSDEDGPNASAGTCPAVRAAWDDPALLERKGYGSMLAALCLAREARAATP